MSLRKRVLRLLVGIALLAALLSGLFAAVIPAINGWGATNDEIARALPGDDQLSHPAVAWTNAIDISAPPAQVWPWVAQLGDTRGGFYSFTFIENRVGALTGASDYAVVYRNADQIVPAWQQPAPGDSLIQGTLKIRAVQPGAWLLAEATQPEIFGWTWLWQLEPIDGGARTRMINRMRIQLPNEAANPVASFLMDIGGFVMQQRMLQGIRLRAEGGVEPWWMERAEICLWLAAPAVRADRRRAVRLSGWTGCARWLWPSPPWWRVHPDILPAADRGARRAGCRADRRNLVGLSRRQTGAVGCARRACGCADLGN